LLKTVLAVAVMTSPARKMTPIVYHLDQGVPSIEQVTFNLHLQIIYTLYTKKNKVAKMLLLHTK
jgi:hydrogenase-4 membrane subunit HyfE